MPQQNLLDPLSSMEGVRLTCQAPEPGLRDHLTIAVEVKRRGGPWWTVYVTTLEGIQADHLNTMASEVVTAWAYGETQRDVQVAAASVKKQAKVHEIRHAF